MQNKCCLGEHNILFKTNPKPLNSSVVFLYILDLLIFTHLWMWLQHCIMPSEMLKTAFCQRDTFETALAVCPNSGGQLWSCYFYKSIWCCYWCRNCSQQCLMSPVWLIFLWAAALSWVYFCEVNWWLNKGEKSVSLRALVYFCKLWGNMSH